MEKPAPTPERFKEYIEADDGSGFFLEDGKMFFPFDEFGGWYDEHDNYYNADGEPSDPPTGYNVEPSRPRLHKDDADDAEELSDPEDEEGVNHPPAFKNKEALVAKITEEDDALIDEFEEGAMVDAYEDVEEDQEDDDLMQSEYIGIDIKSKKLLREGASSLNWLVIPKDPGYDITEDLESLNIPFKKFEYKLDGVHVEIDKSHVSGFLAQSFTPDYYRLFTVHLEQDEDDILPDNNLVAQEQKNLLKERMKRRQPLKTSSDIFIPDGMTLPAPTQHSEKPAPAPQKQARKPLEFN